MSKTIKILGTDYSLSKTVPEKDENLKTMNGYCDGFKHKIVIDQKLSGKFKQHVITHEIVHAFLHESGLRGQGSSDWAVNEEIIDWIASQLLKMSETIGKILKEEKENEN